MPSTTAGNGSNGGGSGIEMANMNGGIKTANSLPRHHRMQAASRSATFIDDDTFSDNFERLGCMPTIENAWIPLAVSIFTQLLICLFAFLAHHHRLHTFDCCNMWTVCVAVFLLTYQGFYVADMAGRYQQHPQWHRNQIFVPMAFFILMFGTALMGIVSMLAHRTNNDIFLWVRVTSLTTTQRVSFFFCTCSAVVAFTTFLAADFAHRNCLGQHLYYIGEEANAQIDIKSEPEPMVPRGVGWSVLVYVVQVLRIDTSANAAANLQYVVITANVTQALFYVFAAVAYSVAHSDLAPIVLVAVLLVAVLFNWNYVQQSQTSSEKLKRRWHRSMLWHGQKFSTLVAVVYLSTMANLFFSTTRQDLWDAIGVLSTVETVYLGLLVGLVCVLLFVQMFVAHEHRAIWGRERLTGLGVRDPNLIRAEHAVFGVVVEDEDPVEKERVERIRQQEEAKQRAVEEARIAKEEEEERERRKWLDLNAHKHERHGHVPRADVNQRAGGSKNAIGVGVAGANANGGSARYEIPGGSSGDDSSENSDDSEDQTTTYT